MNMLFLSPRHLPFQLTMVSVMILNAATGVYQNSLYGLVAILPPRYTNAVILGNNISGTITTTVSVISKLCVSSLEGKEGEGGGMWPFLG